MRQHRNLHHLLGIEHSEVIPHPRVMALTHGRGLSVGASSGDMEGMGLFATQGGGLYATASHGGKLSKIGAAFNKAFNPQKNGVAKAVQHDIVAPVQHDLITPAIKVGDQLKTGVVKTYNQAKTGTSNLDYDLKTGARYLIPAITGSLGGAAGAAIGGLSTFGAAAPIGGIAGSAIGAYAGYKIDQKLGLGNNNDFKPIGKGVKRGRKSKGGNLKQELDKVWDKVPKEFHQPLEDLGRAGVEYAGYKLPPKGKGLKKGAIKNALDKTWKEVPKEFHQPLEDLGRAGVEYAGYKLPPKGKGMKKGDKSKTRKGDLDFTTKKGNMDFHRGGHDETTPESSSDSDTEDGTGVRKKKPRGMGMKKGSPEMKAKMAKLRAMRKSKVTGSGIHGTGQVDNNSPHSGAVRMSPYQNF
jgi:hypothetical protein